MTKERFKTAKALALKIESYISMIQELRDSQRRGAIYINDAKFETKDFAMVINPMISRLERQVLQCEKEFYKL